MRDICHRGNIQHIQARIGDGFGEDSPRVRLDGGREILRLVGLDESRFDAKLLESDSKLRIGAAIERAGSDKMIACAQQGQQRQHFGRHAGGSGQSRAAALKRRHALLEHRRRRVRDT